MRQIRCDQGTNFVGAKRELDDQLLKMDHSEGEVVLKGYMSLNWNVWFQKISIPLPRKVFGLHPPTPSEFPFQGGL